MYRYEATKGEELLIFINSFNPQAGTFSVILDYLSDLDIENIIFNAVTIYDGIPLVRSIGRNFFNIYDVGGCKIDSNAMNSQSPGFYYKYYSETNALIDIQTCGPNTNIDTDIYVFEIINSSTLNCIEYSSTGCSINQASVAFSVDENTNILIFVNSHGDDDTGRFNILLTSTSPTNGFCDNPHILYENIMQTYTTSPTGASIEDVGNCTFITESSTGVYFSYTATFTGNVDIEVCGPNTNIDSDLYIWEGNGCMATTLCDYNDGGCSGEDTPFHAGIYNYPVDEGIEYIIFINSYHKEQFGMFDILITSSIECNKDILYDIIEIPISLSNGVMITDSTIDNGKFGYEICPGDSSSIGVYYNYTSNSINSSYIVISACGPNTNFDVDISVYSECVEKQCLITDDSSCSGGEYPYFPEIVIDVLPNTPLGIFVKGSDLSQIGTFDILLEEYPYSLGDSCDNPVPLNSGLNNFNTKYYFGLVEDIGGCFLSSTYNSYGMFLSYTTLTDGEIFVSTTSEIPIAMYIFSSCLSSNCIDFASSNLENTAITSSYFATAGENIIIFVGSDGNTPRSKTTGDIEIFVSETQTHSYCTGAITLLSDTIYSSQSTYRSVSDYLPSCSEYPGYSTQYYKYTVEYGNLLINIDACSEDIDNMIINVFMGSCENLECIASFNDCNVNIENENIMRYSDIIIAVSGRDLNDYGMYDIIVSEVCPDGEYNEGINSCKLCNSNCVTCSGSSTNCTSCPDGLFLTPVGKCGIPPDNDECVDAMEISNYDRIFGRTSYSLTLSSDIPSCSLSFDLLRLKSSSSPSFPRSPQVLSSNPIHCKLPQSPLYTLKYVSKAESDKQVSIIISS